MTHSRPGLTSLIVLALTLALASGCTSAGGTASASDGGIADASEGEAAAAPAIWVTPSTTVDPTALPLGDQKYVTDGPRTGYIYTCSAGMYQQTGGPGANLPGGDWIDQDAGTYDVTRKPFIEGNVFFPDAVFSVTVSGDQRMIAGNGLPLGVPTGVFPVQQTDPAYVYDRNPNSITTQDISFSIPANPTVAASPSCLDKQVGITLDGIQLHTALDSVGRDELAWEAQDRCTGGPQPGGGYHRHGLSDCTPHIHDRAALIGYALDGFGIYSPYDENGRELTSADLDECHGLTSQVEWEGQQVNMYHYVLTRDFPYTISCFRGTPTRNAFPPLTGGTGPTP